MPRNLALNSLLSLIPPNSREELLSFLAFSERQPGLRKTDPTADLMVSLSFFNASALRPN